MNRHIGSRLESLFNELGEVEEVTLRALKKGASETARLQMQRLGTSKAELARRMGTSRSQVDRVLDPDDTSITLATLAKVASALKLEAHFSLSLPERDTRAPAAYEIDGSAARDQARQRVWRIADSALQHRAGSGRGKGSGAYASGTPSESRRRPKRKLGAKKAAKARRPRKARR